MSFRESLASKAIEETRGDLKNKIWMSWAMIEDIVALGNAQRKKDIKLLREGGILEEGRTKGLFRSDCQIYFAFRFLHTSQNRDVAVEIIPTVKKIVNEEYKRKYIHKIAKAVADAVWTNKIANLGDIDSLDSELLMSQVGIGGTQFSKDISILREAGIMSFTGSVHLLRDIHLYLSFREVHENSDKPCAFRLIPSISHYLNQKYDYEPS